MKKGRRNRKCKDNLAQRSLELQWKSAFVVESSKCIIIVAVVLGLVCVLLIIGLATALSSGKQKSKVAKYTDPLPSMARKDIANLTLFRNGDTEGFGEDIDKNISSSSGPIYQVSAKKVINDAGLITESEVTVADSTELEGQERETAKPEEEESNEPTSTYPFAPEKTFSTSVPDGRSKQFHTLFKKSGGTKVKIKKSHTKNAIYSVGVGMADITGPPVEINFMGYSDLSQIGRGIHTRQFSRAFIFDSDGSRLVYAVAEVYAVGIAVRRGVVKKLKTRFGDMYNLRNIFIVGTGTHSAPGGHFMEFMLDVSILGFSDETYQSYVNGITESIVRAHESIVRARLYYSKARVLAAQLNRSPHAYHTNPKREKTRYNSEFDDTLTQLRIMKMDGSVHGLISWFAVHAVNMNRNNNLISSDNLGYAAMLMEKSLNPNKLVGQAEIIAAFAPSSLGDVSPNTGVSSCTRFCDEGKFPCPRSNNCTVRGPAENMFVSTKLIGTSIFRGAMRAYDAPGEELTDALFAIHQFVDMTQEHVPHYNPITRTFNATRAVKGCVPALGKQFITGTIDGVTTMKITGGTIESPLFTTAPQVVGPAEEDIQCHENKRIILATGRMDYPYRWHPKIVSVSLLSLGGLFVACVPGEPSTMAGRRIVDVITSILKTQKVLPRVVVSALVNEYVHYVTTLEEYRYQSYEGASTIYGPYTLDILLNKFGELTRSRLEGVKIDPGPEPEDNLKKSVSLIRPVLNDIKPIGMNYGNVTIQPRMDVRRGSSVYVEFVGANPRNDLHQESTYITIEREESYGVWRVVARDADWETKFTWGRKYSLLGPSYASVSWEVPENALLGTYRIRYFGTYRLSSGAMKKFIGISDSFRVIG